LPSFPPIALKIKFIMRLDDESEKAVQIQVVAGAIPDSLGHVLITKRPDNVHQGGLWEFPGGKVEAGETPVEGLVRELNEELGIRVLSLRPLIRVHYDYADRRILLHVHRVSAFAGTPYGREGQRIAWVDPDDMDPGTFPAADRPVIAALRLPELFLITGEDPGRPARFLDRLSATLAQGIRLVQLRAHPLGDADYADLAGHAFRLCERHGARLLLNRDPVVARELPCHGLHLTAKWLADLVQRPLEGGRLVGASCHNAEDLSRAALLGLDYAFLSPVQATSSHRDAPPMGWERFAELAHRAMLPVYALGGLGRQDLDRAFVHGAQGVAAVSGLWRGHD
jgi:8-oxo-dGTP diphosphatase